MNTLQSLLTFGFAICMAGSMVAQPLADPPRDRAYEELSFEERRAIPYDNLREADVFWEKRMWRVIDFKEKMNLPFAYPKMPLAQVLIDLVKSGEVTAYNPLDDEFQIPYTAEQVNGKLYRVDTISIFDPDTYMETRTAVESSFDPVWVSKLWIKEDWIFDEETSTIVCRIVGIAPVR